jgi:hypothetical protein
MRSRGILRFNKARTLFTLFPTDDVSCFVNASSLKDPARSVIYYEFVSEIMEEGAHTLQITIPVFCERKSSSFPAPTLLHKFLLHAFRAVELTSLLQSGITWGRFVCSNAFKCIANWRLSSWWCCRKCIRHICFWMFWSHRFAYTFHNVSNNKQKNRRIRLVYMKLYQTEFYQFLRHVCVDTEAKSFPFSTRLPRMPQSQDQRRY